MTVVILLISSSVTYLFLAWATPISFHSVITDNLDAKLDRLIEELQNTTFENSGQLISRFREEMGAEIELTDGKEGIGFLKEDTVDTDDKSDTEEQTVTVESVTVMTDSHSASSVKSGSAEVFSAADSVAIASSNWDAAIRFKDSDREYRLTMSVNVSAVNQTS